ncbi:hypothetical protein ACXJJ3_42285 (plasmid) [Kribbella sp. WER1]
MTVREDVVVSAAVRAKLGSVVEQVLDSLWVIDCQTCNQPLPGRRPALSVDDLISFASASLHHQHCRPSTWNDDHQISAAQGATLTHHTECVLLPVTVGDDSEEIKPFVLINPGLEMIYLMRGPIGQWKVEPNGAFTGAGFAPPPFTWSPVAGAVAQLRGNQLSVIFKSQLIGPYDVTLNDRARKLVEADGGLVVVMTHAVDPHEVAADPAQLEPVLLGDRTVMGYTQLDRRVG